MPNESEVYLAIGAIQRWQGKWAESSANLEKAVSLNPKDIWALQNLAFNYQMLRNFDKANKVIDRALALDPTAPGPLELKSKLAILENGDFSVAEKAFEAAKAVPMTDEQRLKIAGSRIEVFLLERKYREALEQAEGAPDDQLAALPGALFAKYYYIGFARKALHDELGAQTAFQKAKSAAEEQVRRSPTLSDNDRAIQILDGLLSRPSAVTPQVLKINPIWDPLRSDPRFQALMQKYGGKA